ncbi:MAG: hypothetical protein JWP04_2590 [Belnapia sp.]|nr:hypothetical protein [Belnapia sp.]
MEYRSIDGSGNDLADPGVNAANTAFTRLGEAHFAVDGTTPLDGPNPRSISNIVVGEGDAAVPNGQGLSGMMYAWGQFIDHDMTRAATGGADISIIVPSGDPDYADGTFIPLTRNLTDPVSGNAINRVTTWLDGSMVYGSDLTTAASLRLPDGRMATSAGDNLPIAQDGSTFLAGDARVGENPSLTSLQTIFVREHNRQVDLLLAAHPSWTGDELYQQARAIVAAEIAHITYAEFLPALLGKAAIPAYAGYDPTVDPRISVEFAGAAYRWGHSTVSAETERKDEAGGVIGDEFELREVFFMPPAAFAEDGGAGGFLRHLGADLSQAMDARIVDDLRSFLFDPPVGQDLAAINIARGRDLGLGTLNQTREALGLHAYTAFDQITDDAHTVAALAAAYPDVDAIDLWTGGLAERLVPGAFLGETFGRITADQFIALRDGDRLFYLNQGFDAATLTAIEGTSLSDLIKLNTDTEHYQGNAFYFAERRAADVPGEMLDLPQLVIGSDAAETLSGGMQADTLVGGGGDDWMYGGSGDDRYEVDAQADLVFEFTGGGNDTVLSTTSYYLYQEIEALILAATAGDKYGVGNSLANTITGNEGANLLIGGEGADTLLGGAGDDSLYGEAGNDRLHAGTGTDTLAGGEGDDLYVVDGMADLIFEAVDGGNDSVDALVGAGAENAYYLYANIENLNLTGAADSWGIGNALDNALTGNAAANWLLGGSGNDTLEGMAGNDVLFGQAGSDTFVMRLGTGADLVADFMPGEDIILLEGFSFGSFADIQAVIREVDGVTAIDLGGDDLLVIGGVANAALSAADFAFA